jgi:hypothetical protein
MRNSLQDTKTEQRGKRPCSGTSATSKTKVFAFLHTPSVGCSTKSTLRRTVSHRPIAKGFTMKKKTYLVVRSFKDDKYEHLIEITGKSERSIERIEMGLLHQMNTDEFYVEGPVER